MDKFPILVLYVPDPDTALEQSLCVIYSSHFKKITSNCVHRFHLTLPIEHYGPVVRTDFRLNIKTIAEDLGGHGVPQRK